MRAVRVRRSLSLVAPGPRGRPLGSCRVGPRTIFDCRWRGGLCGSFVSTGWFSRSIPSRAVALWGHAALVSGQFLIFPRLRGLLGWLHCVRRTGQFLVFGRFSVALVAHWPPRLRAIFVGGGTPGCPYGAPMSPHLCVQAGFDPPTKLACWGTLVSRVGLGPGLHFRPVPRVCPGCHCTPFRGLARHLKHKKKNFHCTTLLFSGDDCCSLVTFFQT